MTGRVSWFESARISAKYGALPCTTIAAVGDFLSPVGLWLAPLVLGSLALIAAIVFSIREPWAERVLLHRIEPKHRKYCLPFKRSAVFYAMLSFGTVGLVFGFLSLRDRNTGGVLATNVKLVASLQDIIGLSQASLDELKRGREALEGLVKIENTGVADNPRVTLAKQGLTWSEESFLEALSSGDPNDVELFLNGGMRFTSGSLGRAFIHYTPRLAAVIRAHATQISDDACVPAGTMAGIPVGMSALGAWLYGKTGELDKDRLHLFADVCNRPQVRAELEILAKKSGPEAEFFRKILAAF